jgi:hypothetical protein
MEKSNNSIKTFFFIILYFSLLIGFYLGENSSGGAYPDFLTRVDLIEKFNKDFQYTFFNYDNFSDRHSPILIMILSSFNLLGLDLDLIRFIHLNLLPLLILATYKCLAFKFPTINKNILFLICCVFFLSPNLRSIAIWPDSRISGLVLFFFSVYFFLKFQKDLKFKNCLFNNFFLIFSSYLSPNFSIFFIYFFYYYFKHFGFSLKLIIIILTNFILSLPMIYYLIILKVNFFKITAVPDVDIYSRLNLSNKILIISTLIFFYMIPFILNNFFIKKFVKNLRINHFYIASIIFLSLIFYFNYSINYTGGGFFFKLSYFLFNNPILFFITSFISILFIFNIFKINFNNFLLFLILILSTPQLTIYHKYFDVLLIMLFFLFCEFKFDIKKIFNTKFIINIYCFYLFFLGLNFGRYLI